MINKVILAVEYIPQSNEWLVTTTDHLSQVTTLGITYDELRLSAMVLAGADEIFEVALHLRNIHLEEPHQGGRG